MHESPLLSGLPLTDEIKCAIMGLLDGVNKAQIIIFGCAPEIIQVDNGSVFTHTSKTDRIHPLDVL